MVLYVLVGAEIVKRKRALKSIGSDSFPRGTIASADDALQYVEADDAAAGHGTSSRPRRIVSSQVGKAWSFASTLLTRRPTRTLSSGNGAQAARLVERSSLSFKQYVVMPLMFFVVLLAIWVAPTTNRVASFVHPGYESFPLLIAVGATGSLRGFWNGVVFVVIGMKRLQRQRRFDRVALDPT